jgi:hypothetical protein
VRDLKKSIPKSCEFIVAPLENPKFSKIEGSPVAKADYKQWNFLEIIINIGISVKRLLRLSSLLITSQTENVIFVLCTECVNRILGLWSIGL